MKSNRNQRHSRSRSRSRSREREREKEKERSTHNDRERDREKNRDRNNKKDHNKDNRDHNKHQHQSQQYPSHHPTNVTNGRLYFSNIPVHIPEDKVKEIFGKYGEFIDCSLFKTKMNSQNQYYYGNITYKNKQDAESAMEHMTNEFSWYVVPFDKDANKDKNNLKNKKDEDMSSNKNDNLRVREISVKNLPISTTEENLYKEFFIYGEISKIDLKTGNDNKKYAYIKYRLMSSASKACEEARNMNFNGSTLKVSFSNINQRKDIKGNEEGYELNENNCKLIIVNFSKNCESPNEEKISEIFENYGKIKNISVRISAQNQNRPSIYVEYYKAEQAKKAIEELSSDNNLETRKLIGDENCEINFYFKTKSNENINPININNMNMFQNNMFYKNMLLQNMQNMMGMGFGGNNPAVIYQLQNNILNNQINNNFTNNLQNINNNINSQVTDKNPETTNISANNNSTNKQLINNPLNNFNLLNSNFKNQLSKMQFPFNNPAFYTGYQNLNINYQQQPQESMPNYQFQNQFNFPMAYNNQNLPSILNNNFKNQNNMKNNGNDINDNNNKNQNNNDGKDVKYLLKKIMEEKNNKNSNKNNGSDSDVSSLNGSQSAEEMDFEKEYSLEEENLKYIWNGILTKNNKDRVNVDLFLIRGKIDDTYFKEYHLNVCNKIQYEEVMKRNPLGIVAISPQNVTQRESFDEYINYLNEKQRCGVINVSEKYTLYLVSPGEFSRKFYQNPKKHLLGLLVDATVEPNLYVDMNNLALPPPVISLTEKRRLMSKAKNKKTQNEKKENVNNEKDIYMKLKEELNSGDDINNIEERIRQNPEFKEIIEKYNKKEE